MSFDVNDLWVPHGTMWRASVTSDSANVVEYMTRNGEYMILREPHHSSEEGAPFSVLDTVKRCLRLGKGWESRFSKDGFVLTSKHKPTNTVVTLTKVSRYWIFSTSSMSHADQRLLGCVGQIYQFASYECGLNSDEAIPLFTEMYKAMLKKYSAETVSRLTDVMTMELHLRREAAKNGRESNWCGREEPLVRPTKA